MTERIFNFEIMQEIKERWSPRAFSDEKVEESDLMGILEAARYAPSCFNEQPWRFIVAKEEEDIEKVRGTLAQANRVWASKAPSFIIILSKKTFTYNGKDNYWHMFDAGTAWGYLSLEAQRRGLITHAMGGYDRKQIEEIFKVPKDYSIIAILAVGKYGNIEDLPSELREREVPETRKNIEELLKL
jgi:nitroreductase